MLALHLSIILLSKAALPSVAFSNPSLVNTGLFSVEHLRTRQLHHGISPRTNLLLNSIRSGTSSTEKSSLVPVTVTLNAATPKDDVPKASSYSMNNKEIEEFDPMSIQADNDESPYEGILWRGVVVVLCALWASNFAAAKLVMGEPGVDSSLYALARFSVAALSLLPGSISAIKRGVIDWETAKGAAICGSWVSFGYLGQTLGLLSTTASRSCVICSLHCVFVAAIAEFMRVSKSAAEDETFDFLRLLPAAVAVAGVAIVELQGAGGDPNIGDLLSFAQPIGFGMGYLTLENLVRSRPDAGLPISFIKLCMVTLFSFLMFETYPTVVQHQDLALRIPDFTPILSSPLALGGIAYTGLITTALALWVESIAFKRVPATDASIILTTEPLFAAAAGAYTLGETFGMSDYVGASMIIGACALAVVLDNETKDEECLIEDDDVGLCELPRSGPLTGS